MHTIKQIYEQCDVGDVVDVEASIQDIYKKTGEGMHGAWYLTSLTIIDDSDGGTIKLAIFTNEGYTKHKKNGKYEFRGMKITKHKEQRQLKHMKDSSSRLIDDSLCYTTDDDTKKKDDKKEVHNPVDKIWCIKMDAIHLAVTQIRDLLIEINKKLDKSTIVVEEE